MVSAVSTLCGQRRVGEPERGAVCGVVELVEPADAAGEGIHQEPCNVGAFPDAGLRSAGENLIYVDINNTDVRFAIPGAPEVDRGINVVVGVTFDAGAPDIRAMQVEIVGVGVDFEGQTRPGVTLTSSGG